MIRPVGCSSPMWSALHGSACFPTPGICRLFTVCAAGSSAAAGPDEAVCAAKVGRMKLLNDVALHIAHHKSRKNTFLDARRT